MLRDAALILTMRVSGAILWMGYTIVLGRSLTAADFAETLYVINFSIFAVLVITVGCDVALLRFASKAWSAGDHSSIRIMLTNSRRVITVNGGLVTSSLVLLSILGLDTAVTDDLGIALVTGLLIITGGLMGLNRECLRAVGKVWQSQLGINFTRSVVPILGSIFLFALNVSLNTKDALLLLLLSLILSLVIEEFFIRRIDWKRDLIMKDLSILKMQRAGLALWPGDIANALLMRSVGLVGALALQPEAAALLLAAERIAGLAQFPISASTQAAGPRIAQATNSNDEVVQKALDHGSALMIAGALIGFLLTGFLAWPALWALGPDFSEALPTTLVLISTSLAWAFFGLAQSALNLTGRSHHYSVITICVTIVTVTGIWFAAVEYGGFGAAVAWCIGWWVANIAYTITFKSLSGLDTGVLSVARRTVSFLTARR